MLRQAGIKTLADLTLRVPRRRRWWVDIGGLGAAGARRIEGFFAAHPDLTDRARALVVSNAPEHVVPWEKIVVPQRVDGTMGLYRAPRASCILRANNDFEAVQAWLSLHEAPATQRAYRKEAERLILWAIVERGVALSSLATEDAVAYRADSKPFQILTPRMAARDFEPVQWRVKTLAKDLGLADALAKQHGLSPLVACHAKAQLEAYCQSGHADDDLSSIIGLYAASSA